VLGCSGAINERTTSEAHELTFWRVQPHQQALKTVPFSRLGTSSRRCGSDLRCAHCLRKNVTGVGSLPHLRCYRRPSV
jgi:hypothetical protein